MRVDENESKNKVVEVFGVVVVQLYVMTFANWYYFFSGSDSLLQL